MINITYVFVYLIKNITFFFIDNFNPRFRFYLILDPIKFEYFFIFSNIVRFCSIMEYQRGQNGEKKLHFELQKIGHNGIPLIYRVRGGGHPCFLLHEFFFFNR